MCVILSLIGIGLAGYLTYLHLGLLRGELLGGPACSGSGAFNCHAVTSGAWGSFLGAPLSLWGILGYTVILALALLAEQSPEMAVQAMTLVFIAALLFVGIDLALLSLMVFVIRFYCLFCLLTYLVNLSLLVVSARSLSAPWTTAFSRMGTSLGALLPSRQHPAAWLFWGMLMVAMLGTAGVHAATTFVNRGTLAGFRQQIREYVLKQPRVVVNTDGDPRTGSADAKIQMVEFSDFFCPACQRASRMNAIILANHRDDVSFVFKNFPLDNNCNEKIQHMVHPGACQMAVASECLQLQGKFWSFHDMVFEKGHDYNLGNLERDVERLGADMGPFRSCMASGQGREAVRRDIEEAGKANVGSTPTFVINGIPMTGGLNPSVFDDLVAVLQETANR